MKEGGGATQESAVDRVTEDKKDWTGSEIGRVRTKEEEKVRDGETGGIGRMVRTETEASRDNGEAPRDNGTKEKEKVRKVTVKVKAEESVSICETTVLALEEMTAGLATIRKRPDERQLQRRRRLLRVRSLMVNRPKSRMPRPKELSHIHI